MAKTSYLTANVTMRDSFSQWISKYNQISTDMGTVVLTAGAVLQPNNTNGAWTTGNTHLDGIFSAETIAVGGSIRGGTVSSPSELTITSNVVFSSSPIVTISANTANFNINANNIISTSNASFNGSNKQFVINNKSVSITTAQNVDIEANGDIHEKSINFIANNTTSRVISSPTYSLTSSNVSILAANTTIGSNGTQKLNIRSDVTHNANTIIIGTATFANTIIHNGSSATFNNNLIVGSNSSDVLTLNSRITNSIIPTANVAFDIGAPLLKWKTLEIDAINASNNVVVSKVLTVGDGINMSANASPSRITLLGANSTVNSISFAFAGTINSEPLLVNPNGIFKGTGGGNIGNTTSRWTSAYVDDVFTANANVSGQMNVNTIFVSNSPNTRLFYSNNGILTTNANLTFSGTTLNLPNVNASNSVTTSVANAATINASTLVNVSSATQSTSISSGAVIVNGGVGIAKNLNVGGAFETNGDTIIRGNLQVLGTTLLSSNTSLSLDASVLKILTVQETVTLNTGVTISGNILPLSNNSMTIGSSTRVVKEIYTNTVHGNSFTGNANTASTLETARNINGVSFNGSANITVNDLPQFANSANQERPILFSSVTNASGSLARQHYNTNVTINPSTSTIYASHFNITSDKRLKSEIVKINGGLNIVNKLQGVTFKKNGKKQHGVIAQDVEKVIPEAINKNDQGWLTVDTNQLHGFYIEAIKELTDRVISLQTRIAELEER